MRRWIAFAIIVTWGIAALAWSEWRRVDVRVDPAALLYFIADSEWELSRLPMALTRLSDTEEIELGNRMAAATSLGRTAELNPEQKQQAWVVENYVSRVGGKVAAHARRKLPYRFHYIPDMDFVNAFALPGGHVYIGAGLLALMDSEDELAAVLGHEIEHIDHYHCVERWQWERRLRRIPAGELAMIPVVLFQAGYQKDQELEADREGTQMAVWAGYSPLGAMRMFETYDRLYQEYVRQTRSPQEELSRAAIETLQGYFRSHPPARERIVQISNLIAARRWVGRSRERNLEVAYVFWTARAQRAYDAGRYFAAAGLAQQSLKMQPQQSMALQVLGKTQFAQADFAGAAAAFRQALSRDPADDGMIANYADALAARHSPAESLRAFAAWMDSHPQAKARREARLQLARLTLAARGVAAADKVLFPAMAPDAAALPPELRGRYGWWLYGSGQFDAAAKWLQSAVQELPSDPLLSTRLGWVLIEQHNLEAAMQRFEPAAYPSSLYELRNQPGGIFNERRMGLAVAEWQARQFDRAVGEFAGASISRPEWRNPRWVEALYSPGVAKTIEQLKAAQKARH